MAGIFGVDGLVSGLKTSEIIQGLMALERRPLNLLQAQQTRYQTRVTALNAIRQQVSALLTAIGNLSLHPAVASSTTAPQTTAPTSSGPYPRIATSSNPSVLTATAALDATPGSFKVTVSQLATATSALSSGSLGSVDRRAPLASAGFTVAPTLGTFTINGKTITLDSATTLDDGSANSVIAKINAAGAGVTARLLPGADGRAAGTVELVSAPGQTIQLGAAGDTSNLLSVLNLTGAAVQGNTAASVTSGAVRSGRIRGASVTVNGVTTAIDQTNNGFTAAQNTAFIVNAINSNAANTVSAIDNGNGTFTLQQKTLGSQQVINITAVSTGRIGLVVGRTQNGTDRVVSTAELQGVANTSAPLASSRLVVPISGLDATGNGAFSINGVTISYNASESIDTILARINSSAAGVTATYDAVQDRISLLSKTTGATAIALSDVTGNFLTATKLTTATQTLGLQAQFSIDTVNGGAVQTSNSNTVTGVVQGVTLDLKATSASPVTVTITEQIPPPPPPPPPPTPGADNKAAVDGVKAFVDAFNKVLDTIGQQTKYDPQTRTSGALVGDSGVLGIERALRTFANSPAVGATGAYRTLADIGISTGAYRSGVGTTNRLVVDESKLNAAIAADPQAVNAVLSGFAATLSSPTGAGNITAVSGTPLTQHSSGTYYIKVVDAATRKVEVRFAPAGGTPGAPQTATLASGVADSSLIAGLRLDLNGTLAVGEDSFSIGVTNRAVTVPLTDYLKGLLSPTGFFTARDDSAAAISRQIANRIDSMQGRLKDREARLVKQFAQLETLLSRLQTQSQGPLAQLAAMQMQMSNSGSAR